MPAYEIEGREMIAEAPGLRVQVLTVGAGQCVPWHHHTEIRDTFFCLEGRVMVEARAPEETILLEPGERTTVGPGRPHRVTGEHDGRCKFLIVQGVGTYDYVPD